MVKLHIGCGRRRLEGYVHIDGADFPHIDHHDVTKLPFEDNSVDECYSAHLIAYFDRIEVQELLDEWYRVLKPGGVMRIATPDFRAIVGLYLEGTDLFNFSGLLFGKMKMRESSIYHKQTYDFDTLKFMLELLKFKNVQLYDYKTFLPEGYDDHSMAHFPHSEEAIKTGNYSAYQTLVSLNVQCQK